MTKKKTGKRGPARAVKVQPLGVQALLLMGIFFLVVAGLAYVLLAQWATIRVPAAVIQSEIIAMTNDERTQNSVGVLTENALLDQAAQAKANDMAAKGYFSHTGPDGKTPWQWIAASGYDYHYAGENLAVRFSDSSQVVSAWMASPTHRANIVKAVYTQIGVGVADGMYEGQPATFVVQYFGTPAAAASAPVVAKKAPAPAAPAATPVARAATSSAAVEGAQTVAQPALPQPSFWERFVGLIASALNSLTASVAESQPSPVMIGAGGVSTQR